MRLSFTVLLNLSCLACFAQIPDLITLRTTDLFQVDATPQREVPPSLYTGTQVSVQKKINRSQAESIVTYSPVSSHLHWNKIDHEEITPYTWRWVSMEVAHPNGEQSIVTLRRPLWWLKQHGLDAVENTVYLSIEEFAIRGMATVTKIYASQIDTRFWDEDRQGDFACMPIIGKFEHVSNNVLGLYTESGEEVLVTGNHPIWSHERNRWVEADSLASGEYIRTRWGITKLIRKENLPGTHKVYNIEVYRSHNYFASETSILAHNGPCGINFRSDYWIDMIVKSFYNESFVTPFFKAHKAIDIVGSDYNVLLYDLRPMIKRNIPLRLTYAMESIIAEARASKAEYISIMIADQADPNVRKYFSRLHEVYEGFQSNADEKNFGFVGKLKDIRRRNIALH